MEITKKIVLLGQFGVGKTSLTRRFMDNSFDHDYLPTLGVQIKKKTITMPSGNKLSMIVWDLEGFASVSQTRASYLLGTNGFIYVFDITRPFTYINLDKDIEYIQANYPRIALAIIGNKSDVGNSQEAIDFLKTKQIEVSGFTSAKTGEGVQEVFNSMAKKVTL